ncbi:hypothetical protein NKW43_15425 [Gluconobacter albidus]|uniref:hypothetical protein n=1 Tax=Gluconobacter albidus TaxID=318683 RepID=UPI0020A11445|nr:hypothetical protein [Gluconobacter albidus]MCP1275047.1 hypothetical protein [Gluconobacter albidus]
MRRLSYLALSMALVAGPALAVPTSPSNHGLFDQAPYPSSASGILTYDQINEPNGVAGLDAEGKIPSGLINGGGGGSYTLPPATSSTLGGVKVGTGLAVTTDGTVSVNVDLSGYLPVNNPTFTGTLKNDSDSVELGILGIALKGGGHYLQTHWDGNLSFYTDSNNPTFTWQGSFIIQGGVQLSAAAGTGNAFACIDANGNLYRSATACQ